MGRLSDKAKLLQNSYSPNAVISMCEQLAKEVDQLVQEREEAKICSDVKSAKKKIK